MRTLAYAILLWLAAAPAAAQLLELLSDVPVVPGAPAGVVVNDLRIDFEGQLYGQQMVIELQSGSIYQDPLGGETAPNDAIVDVFPSVAADTFVTIGGPTLAESSDVLVVGGSTEFEQSTGLKQFDATRLDIAWAPAAGLVILDQADFLVARVALSDDALGRLLYYGNGLELSQRVIDNGVITRPLVPHEPIDPDANAPEPTALVLLSWLALPATFGRRR